MADELDTFGDFADGCSLQSPGVPLTNIANHAVHPGEVLQWASDGTNWSEPILTKDHDSKEVKINGDLVIEDPETGDKINVSDFMKTVQDRLCILQPNFEAMEEYPALKDAYDQYKMLEKLLLENNKPKK